MTARVARKNLQAELKYTSILQICDTYVLPLMYSIIPGGLRRPRMSLTGSMLALSAIRSLAIWLMRLPVSAMYDAGAAAPVYDRPNVIGGPHIHPVVGEATNIGCGRPVGNGQTPFGNRSISMSLV